MIRLSHQSTGIRRISRRRRISNQLAAVAAIMLFASTQVDFSGQSDDAPASGDPVETWQATSISDEAQEAQEAPESTGTPQAATTQRSTSLSKGRSNSFSLFLFRG